MCIKNFETSDENKIEPFFRLTLAPIKIFIIRSEGLKKLRIRESNICYFALFLISLIYPSVNFITKWRFFFVSSTDLRKNQRE